MTTTILDIIHRTVFYSKQHFWDWTVRLPVELITLVPIRRATLYLRLTQNPVSEIDSIFVMLFLTLFFPIFVILHFLLSSLCSFSSSPSILLYFLCPSFFSAWLIIVESVCAICSPFALTSTWYRFMDVRILEFSNLEGYYNGYYSCL
jgi:hypothetical protein